MLLLGDRANMVVIYLDDSSNVHLGDHLSSVKEHQHCVQSERHILQWRVMFKGLGSVHTHRNDTDDGTSS